jgi:predicted AlkP superfamily pyrophosphatase or phosphodiesterase
MRLGRFLLLAFASFSLTAAPTEAKRYLLVIGIDGMRADYADRYGAKNLQQFRDSGASAAALIPSYPSSTFPNFYSIATGLAPENHGIVGMSFYDPQADKGFDSRNGSRETGWFRGTPIWLLAERQGMKSATFTWVGSEAKVGGQDPTYFRRYESRATHLDRISQIREWLELPEERRPQLVMTYFSEIDTAGHAHGPESEEVRQAVLKVDESVGMLLRMLESVRPETNVIIVSDHGMTSCGVLRSLSGDVSQFRVVNQGDIIRLYAKDPRAVEPAYRALRETQGDRYRVYRRHQIPRHLRHRNDPRIGDLVLIAEPGQIIAFLPPGMTDEAAQRYILRGCHGADPARSPNLNGVFYARGPEIRNGVRLGKVSNLDIFPVMTKLLGLTSPKVDGSDRTARKMLRRQR